jgi:hypothetical protein
VISQERYCTVERKRGRLRHKIREDKDETAKCPFCAAMIKAPEEIKTESGGFIGGKCECGAVYVCDPTGHNVGEAYLDALTYASGDNALSFDSLDVGEDYREAVFNYDLRGHRLFEIRDIRRDYSCKIIFVTLGRKS